MVYNNHMIDDGSVILKKSFCLNDLCYDYMSMISVVMGQGSETNLQEDTGGSLRTFSQI